MDDSSDDAPGRDGPPRLRFHCACRDDQMVLWVSARALDRAVAATDSEPYATVNPAKVALMAALSARLRAPQVAASEGSLGFIDGRHRARASLAQGRLVLPIVVSRDNADAVRAVLARFKRPSVNPRAERCPAQRG